MNDSTKCCVAKIVPTPGQASTHGTRVMLSNGLELQGVTAIDIQARSGDIWTAKIELTVVLTDMPQLEMQSL